jgi:hypothetical protein
MHRHFRPAWRNADQADSPGNKPEDTEACIALPEKSGTGGDPAHSWNHIRNWRKRRVESCGMRAWRGGRFFWHMTAIICGCHAGGNNQSLQLAHF